MRQIILSAFVPLQYNFVSIYEASSTNKVICWSVTSYHK